MNGAWDILGFLLVLGALGVAGIRRSKGSEEYLVAGRRVELFALVATLVMTEFNPSTLLAFTGMGYRAGPMALALPLVFLIGLGWYTVVVARAWKRFDRLSVAELFADRYGPALGRLASSLLILAMLGFSATYVKSLTLIFLPRSPLGEWGLSAIMTALVVAFTAGGGLVSVIRSDWVSFILTLVFVPALALVAAVKGGGLAGLRQGFAPEQLFVHPISQWSHPMLPFWFTSSLIVITMFTYICSPWYGQKIFAARDERTAYRAVGISACLVFLLYGAGVMAASFFKSKEPGLQNPELALPRMIELWMPPLARGAMFGVVFAAALTTLAGVWSAIGAMVAADFSWKRGASVAVQRWITVILGVLSWLGANLLVDDILNRLILANIPIAALSFALLAGFYWKRASRKGAWISVSVGIAWGMFSFLHWGDAGGYTFYWAFWGIPLIFLSGFLGSCLWPDPTIGCAKVMHGV